MSNYPYPLTIVLNRYGGTYEGGRFAAFNEDPENLPWEEIQGDDVDCAEYWSKPYALRYRSTADIVVGVGETPDDAVVDLERKLRE